MTTSLRLACATAVAVALPLAGVATASASTTDTKSIVGSDRYATSVAVSKQISTVHQAKGVSEPGVVVVASAADFPDGLTAGVAASYGNSRVLLVPPTGPIPSSIVAEINRLAPSGAVIVGGQGAVGADVEKQLRGLGLMTSRMSGTDRYATAAAVAATALAAGANTLVIGSGEQYPDALSGSAAAIRFRGPLLLTKSTVLPAASANAIRNSSATNFIVLGGPGAISDAVITQIKANAPANATVTRLAGANRWETSAAISAKAYTTANTVYLTSGWGFADALSAGPAAAAEGGPLLLTAPNCVPKATLAEIKRLGATQFRVVGGPAAYSANVINRVACSY